MNIETNKYHVTYWYLATGQEGVPYTHDYGIIEANTSEEAKLIAVKDSIPRLTAQYPKYSKEEIEHIALDGIGAELIQLGNKSESMTKEYSELLLVKENLERYLRGENMNFGRTNEKYDNFIKELKSKANHFIELQLQEKLEEIDNKIKQIQC